MHQVFGAIRVWQLRQRQGLIKHADAVAERLFGREGNRWDDALRPAMKQNKDARAQLMDLSVNILHTSGYTDEPSDIVRTMSNMELASFTYIDEMLPIMDRWPIYVADPKKPRALVGIELAFDTTLTYDDGKQIRYIGTIDGLCESHSRKRLFMDENKTAVRLDEGWRKSFQIAHQVSGYSAISTTVVGLPVFDARIMGLKIKPSGKGEDFYSFEVERTEDKLHHWGRWVYHTVAINDEYADDFEHAPRYTHSCNRYFRPCVMIPFCDDTPEGRIEQYSQMVPAPLSPSEHAVMEI